MRVSTMACAPCQIKIEGVFCETSFHQLPPEDLSFLEQYMLAGFSIKALEKRTGMGYAAIRTRLDRLIERYRALLEMEEQKKAVLEKIRSGAISATEGARILRTLGGMK